MLISFAEIVDIIIMTAAVGFIFMAFLRRRTARDYMNPQKFDWDSFKMACIITAPALIFHELAHKFVALGLGFNATFHAAYIFLALGIVLRLMRSNFIFFVPGFVTISCAGLAGCSLQPSLQTALIAGAGPFMNLALFAGSALILKYNKNLKKKTMVALHFTKLINLFLFAFNMLPFYIFDGYKFFSGLYYHFF